MTSPPPYPFIASLATLPGIQKVVMTTNGLTLSHKLPQLKAAGLAGVNVSLDTLQPAKFSFITRRQGKAETVWNAFCYSLPPSLPQVLIR